jgi:hypothetical protein
MSIYGDVTYDLKDLTIEHCDINALESIYHTVKYILHVEVVTYIQLGDTFTNIRMISSGNHKISMHWIHLLHGFNYDITIETMVRYTPP